MTATMIPAPPCPTWCTERHPAGGWTVHMGEATKMCTRTIAEGRDVDGEPITVTVQQFADVTDGTVYVSAPTVEVLCDNRLDLTNTLELARALTEAARIVKTG